MSESTPTTETLTEAFWGRVDRTSDCWLWTGKVNTKGYGRLSVGRRDVMAHRVAYESLIGPIPEGLELDHLCRVRNCVNPSHLEPVTTRENVLRGASFSAMNAAKTHCPSGHEYTAANTYLNPSNNSRICRECQSARSKARDRSGKPCPVCGELRHASSLARHIRTQHPSEGSRA